MNGWQHLPETIDPIAGTIGFFSVHWYAVWFLIGFFVMFFFALHLTQRGVVAYPRDAVFDMLAVLFFGALIGGRIGYVLLYHPDVFLENPIMIFSPYDFGRGVWTGLSGMSYYGGLIGVTVALVWFSARKKLSFWKMADFAALLAPVAIFFGRLGNFFNVELPGRITAVPWGMVFPGTLPRGVLRHPSTLYEAFFEGVVLLGILLFLRRQARFDGALACFFLALYAGVRFGSEYFREPDPQLGLFFNPPTGGFTLGQILSFAMLCITVVIFVWLKRKNRVKIVHNA
ncbi:MAG: prolipoprotein diacylglyceryl transferase [Candidatus Moranbacteria bacterium]|nr:prolipoprotein diacylglyceryl transferase [Candidatus Moranbacteria bacterium]